MVWRQTVEKPLITWINVDQHVHVHMASLDHNELKANCLLCYRVLSGFSKFFNNNVIWWQILNITNLTWHISQASMFPRQLISYPRTRSDNSLEAWVQIDFFDFWMKRKKIKQMTFFRPLLANEIVGIWVMSPNICDAQVKIMALHQMSTTPLLKQMMANCSKPYGFLELHWVKSLWPGDTRGHFY